MLWISDQNCLSAPGTGMGTVRQYGGMHVAGVADPWFGSDPKPCCVRELHTGTVTGTLYNT